MTAGAKSPATVVSVSVTSPSLLGELVAGDELNLPLSGSWSAKKVQPGAVYIQARDPAGRFATPAVFKGTEGAAFTFVMRTVPTLAAGTHAGTIEVRACKDSACLQPYPESFASVSYQLKVAALADWETHQRDAAHRGYVPVSLDPSRFAKAWEWTAPGGPSLLGINPVVTGNGKVYVTRDVYSGEGVLFALNESDGSEAWRFSFGTVPALNPPAVSQGRVYAAVTGHESTALWAFDANTGTYLHKSRFEGQWPNVMAPTVRGDRVYTGAGYYGGMTYSFSTADGSRQWVHSAGGAWDMFTPAVDDRHVYHYNGSTLFLIDPVTGGTTASIADPLGSTSSGYAYHGSPMLGSRDNVVAFAGLAFSGRASSNVEQYDQRVLSSFNIATRSYEWSTPYAYLTAPAVANGVIYAARNNPMSLDAIDEVTGKVLWNWTPSGKGDLSFHRNVVVTRNLLFVSTDRAVYALDLATRQPVWSYPRPGMLALSAERTLYIATGARESDGGLVAVRLK